MFDQQDKKPHNPPHKFFAFLNRLKLINRWSLMRNLNAEDVAQHSHLTAMLAHALGLIDREVFHKPTQPDRCAVIALYHETAEVLTGDMPTPVKYRNDQMTAAVKAAEFSAEERLLKLLPDALKPGVSAAVQPGVCREAQLVKFADKIAAYIKCVEELSAGNREFLAAKESTEQSLTAHKDPTIDYFMENFADSFAMNLDELMKE